MTITYVEIIGYVVITHWLLKITFISLVKLTCLIKGHKVSGYSVAQDRRGIFVICSRCDKKLYGEKYLKMSPSQAAIQMMKKERE